MNDYKMRISIEIPNDRLVEDILRKGEWEDDSLFGRSIRNALMHFTKESLEQELRTGHWIKIVVNGLHKIRCDKCDYIEPEYATYIRNYCPNCGARMIDPQEREEISDRNLKMWEELFKAESEG